MRTTRNRGVASILALAMTIGAAALLQAGCVVEPEVGESVQDEFGDSWTASYISIDSPSGTIGPKVLDIRAASQVNGARAQLWQSTGGSNQKWDVTEVGSWQGHPSFQLVAHHSGKCLDMAIDGPVGSGTRVQQWDCSQFSANQVWIAMADSGWGELRSAHSPALCLDVTGVRYADGALLQVWECTGNWNQRWNIYP